MLTNTEYERLALTGGLNLSDGHARATLDAEQRRILTAMDRHLQRADSAGQDDLEHAFLESFFALAGETRWQHSPGRFLTFSASSAIKIAAQVCRLRQQRVLLIEPCFDNIRHLLATEGVDLQPLPENEIISAGRLLDEHTTVWLVLPNNPTGFTLDRHQFRRIAHDCAVAGATLIVDSCFRFHTTTTAGWSRYEILHDENPSFALIEDTGKTWPTYDLKIGATLTSADLAPDFHRLHDQLLLNVSPLHLIVLREFIDDSRRRGLGRTVTAVIDRNRTGVHALVDDGLLGHPSPWCANVPMEFLALPHDHDAVEFWAALRERHVDILPAHNYYWSDPTRGRGTFRIPLSRPPEHLDAAVDVIRQVLNGR
ncbi:aminotransferase class I/II-fold pyridoxal phosphate-dependent enzyme [Micromonospora sp. NPDC049751]|uniref:aminotransferase class I/II-fold pyridoxal phosphate-dependent enzyme n=1 Tax=Micromonospora sp. NPDC049751 TaxID=3154837 RepID=UPI00340F50B7